MQLLHFTSQQSLLLIIGGALLIFSTGVFRNKTKLGLALLFLGSLTLGLFMASLDPFLNIWDEQYHALVAKNLSNNLLKPTLYSDPVLNYDYRNWTENAVWLHKQPLFLWQMAASIKIFGANEIAIRLPSAIMHAIIPLFINRIGKIAVNRETGFYGALFFAVAYFPLELIAGTYPTDHNDVAFLFYITASFWAWFEYSQSKKKYWLLLIGLFGGCAVLVKWLMGLLVFVIWTLVIAFSKETVKQKLRSFLPALTSGAISLIVFLPWQLYTHLVFPKVAAYELKLNSRHFFEAIEKHTESTWFYFTDGFQMVYGSAALLPFIFLIGLTVMILKIHDRSHRFFISTAVIFVYAFYTVAATKMVSFPIIVAPFLFLGLGFLIDFSFSILESRLKWTWQITLSALRVVVVLVVGYSLLNLSKIEMAHTSKEPDNNRNRSQELREMEFIESLDKKLGEEKYVIFNSSITINGHIPVMFYTDHVAYDFVPSKAQIEKLKKQDRRIAIVDLGNLPTYILEDEAIRILTLK
ncbi:ArnT family glycosyltransferase [Halocola ammonii]